MAEAIVLLGKGDCWHGGGLFTGPHTYWVNDGYGHTPLEDSREVRRDDQFRPAARYGGECPGVYYLRLQRDGWALRRLGDAVAPAQFEKPLPRGWILRKVAHAEIGAPPGKGCYWDEHELEHGATDQLARLSRLGMGGSRRGPARVGRSRLSLPRGHWPDCPRRAAAHRRSQRPPARESGRTVLADPVLSG